MSNRLRQEGLLLFITINYNIQKIEDTISFDRVDYSNLSNYLDGYIFLKFVWGTNYGPPAPISNINYINVLIDYITTSGVPKDKIIVGNSIIAYDWKLPYIPGKSVAVSLTVNSVISLAYEVGAVIQFDDESQSPYFYYNEFAAGVPSEHIVWFIDARSINALNNLIIEYGLYGCGIWNLMIYNAQLWTVINSKFDVIKLI